MAAVCLVHGGHLHAFDRRCAKHQPEECWFGALEIEVYITGQVCGWVRTQC